MRDPFRRSLARRAFPMHILSNIEKQRPTRETMQVLLSAVVQVTMRCCVFRRQEITNTRENLNLSAHLETIGEDLFIRLDCTG